MNDDEELKQEDGTGTAPVTEEPKAEPEQNATEAPENEKETMLTQSQVNEIVTKRLAKQAESFYKRYGVSDESQFDELFKKAKDYEDLSKKMSELSTRNSELNERVLFNKVSITADREDDVRTYFKGKGLEMNEKELTEAVKTHPEWCNSPKETIAPIPLGSTGSKSDETDEERALKLFGLKHFVS